MVVVNKGTAKDGGGVERDAEILRLQVNMSLIICFIYSSTACAWYFGN